MSLLNQPSRIFISSDDLEWGQGGYNYNITLAEAVQGAAGVDCARAVIPTTLYPIPDYQNKFVYSIGGVDYQLTLTNSRNFANLPDLVAQLNADAIAQSQALVFSFNSTTDRVSVVIGDNTPRAVIIAGVNDQLVMNADAGPNPQALLTIPEGNYTLAEFATVLQTTMQPFITSNDVPHVGPGATIAVSVVGGNTLKFDINKYASYPLISFNFKGIPYTGSPPADDANRAALTAIMGFPWNATPNQGTYFIFVSNSLSSITAPNPAALTVPTVAVAPRTEYPIAGGVDDVKNRFAVNTRLGFPYSGLTGTAGTAIVGTILPNLLRTKVVYVLCNIAVNDSLSTDGLRNVLCKIPVNSVYGGYTFYAPAELNFCRIVPQTYQNIQISYLDENYQSYPLNIEEISEIELVFKYDE
jgi:hypothetical protein